MAGQMRQAKVLCIRMIQGKNVLDKTIDPGESVTIGESAKNTFVLPSTHLKQGDFSLFRSTGNGYVLQFTEEMRGKIESHGSVASLQQLFNDTSVTRSEGVAQIPLTEQDRGKLKVDSVTLLFQFLPPPPAQALKPIQQMDFRPRLLNDDDPAFLGFLALWMAFATVLVIWVWNTEPREFNLEELPDRFAKVTLPSVEEPPPEVEEAEVEEGDGPSADEPEPEPAVAEAEQQAEEQQSEVEQIAQEEERKQELLEGSVLLKMIGTTGEGRGVVQNLWSPEEQGLGDIDAALAEGGVITPDQAQLRNVAKGGNEAADVELKGIGGGNGQDVSGPAVTVKPRVRAEAGTIDASWR